MSEDLGRLLRRWRHATLGLGAVVGSLCVLTALAGVVLDVHPLVFQSGSMAPTIDTGAVAVVHRVDAPDLDEGDVVSVATAGGSRVTHRVVQITHAGDGATLQLKGDANRAPDARVYDVRGADRVMFSVPRAGYVVSWLTGPRGSCLLGLYAAFLVIVLLRGEGDTGPSARQIDRGGRRRAPRGPRSRGGARVLTIVSALVLTGGAAVGRATPVWAAWTDAVAVTGTSLGAVVPAAPLASCQPLALDATRVTWTPAAAATGYRVHYGSSGGTTEDVGATTTSYTFQGGLSGISGTFFVQAIYGTSKTWISQASNSLSYTSVAGMLGTCR